MANRPNSENVAVAWVKSITGGTNAATDLPQDTAGWAATGFYQLSAVGGTPDVDLPIAQPVISVDCWAVSPSSGKPPVGKAFSLAEAVRTFINSRPFPARRVTPSPGDYNAADVTGAIMLTEPRKIKDDNADYAHVTFDLLLDWVEVTP